MGIKETIEDILKLPCFDNGEAIVYPCVTLDSVPMSPSLMGDGKPVKRTKSVTAIIYQLTKLDRDLAASILIQALDGMDGFTPPDVIYDFDETSRKWRATFSFEYI